MGTKVFITGATGYIGGDVLYAVHTSHPDWSYSALVRSEDKAAILKKAYPNVRIVIGDLDASDILTEESANADIVIHTADASDHEPAAKAIAAGLIKGHSSAKPGFWIHTGGTGILTYVDSDAERYGEPSTKVYDDLDGIEELTHLPDHAFHRNVDQAVLEAGTVNANTVKTAIVCPPTIYGTGRGPCSQRSRQVYELARTTLQLKKAPIIGQGQSMWNHVHIVDLSQLFCLLAERAAASSTSTDLWGANGYFLAENGEHVWGEVAKKVAEVAAQKGYIPSPETQQMGKEEALKTAGFEALSWGMNSRGVAKRARKLLGWIPSSPSLYDEIPNIVDSEYKRL